MQGVPFSSPCQNHQRLHDHYNESVDWMYARQPFVDLWDTRMERALASPPLMHGEGCIASYLPWFHRVTHRYIINPDYWPKEGALQGTQLSTQELANHILQDPISRAQRRPREWAPTKRRGWPPVTPVVPEEGTYYTHVGSSHLASISHSVGTEGAGTSETGGWSPFIQSSTYEANTSEGGAWPQWVNLPTYAAAGTSEAGYTVRLGDDEARDDEGPSQDHLAKSYVYRPDMSFLEDQHHTPPPFTQVPSFGSPTYRFGSPAVTFTPMMSTTGENFPHLYPLLLHMQGIVAPGRTQLCVHREQQHIRRRLRRCPSLRSHLSMSRDCSHLEQRRGRVEDVILEATSSGIRRSRLFLICTLFMFMYFYYAFCLSLCTFIRVERFMYFDYVYVLCTLFSHNVV
ncbi:uncharacterized protein LOC135147879 [Daucus carota subsp. sativus]|uniref:uncharacterized protein LOC135147879 n=1 Tax=Daucus carota subsp. sativus TaxID=79200 RepID=UPI0030834B67